MDQHNGTEWRGRAACRNVDRDLFFPIGEKGRLVADQIRRARIVCWDCPVRQPCLAEALRTGSTGIWAGTTEDERRALTAQGVTGELVGSAR